MPRSRRQWRENLQLERQPANDEDVSTSIMDLRPQRIPGFREHTQHILSASHWKIYKPVYVDNTEVTSDAKGTSGTAGFSNLNGTVKVFSSTSDIIVTNHDDAHKIIVPFTPANVYEYDAVFSQAGAEWNSVAFTSVPVNVTTYGSYHEITITVSRTLNVDVKISK